MHIEVHRLWPRRPRDGSLPLGLSCDDEGLLLAGNCRLIAAALAPDGQVFFRARPPDEINAVLSAGYGAAVDISDGYPRIERLAGYMSRGEWTRAAIAALNLRLPELPDQAAARRVLEADRLLKLAWNSDLHPRWPAHSEEGRGGRFRPGDGEGGAVLPVGYEEDRRTRDRIARDKIQQIDPLLRPGQLPSLGVPGAPPAAPGGSRGAGARGISAAARAAAWAALQAAPALIEMLPSYWSYLQVYIHGPFELSDLRASDDFQSFKTFDAFKKRFPSGEGWEWHHLVEQTESNEDRFGGEQIHNTDNVIALPKLWHEMISNYYSSNTKPGGPTVREVVSKMSYEEQREFALNLLRERGLLK